MNFLLTGCTGILGSHIMFEWLKDAHQQDLTDTLFVVIRDNDKSAAERLKQVLESPSRPDYMNNFSLESCLSKIVVIASDLSTLTKEFLSAYNFTTVLHCAGSTNLLNTAEAKETVKEQNFAISKAIVENLPTSVSRFIYISTAYSFGIQNQKVGDKIGEYTVDSFRNPYEQSKFESEQFVKEQCKNLNIECQILRPSIICGRLLDAPFYETSKYDVFYSWAIFLDKYAKKSNDLFRIWIDNASGLNIIPVDFVAKAVVYALNNKSVKELNIVNPQQVLHRDYIGDVLKYFGVNIYEYASKKPENLNMFEQLYYKTIGSLFEKYISIPDLQYKDSLIHDLIKEWELEPDLGVKKNFMNLINYAVDNNFKESY
ncbi:SDR family oxidoreductase [Flavobacteriaceae bacterium]|nr:SDR family oxidoreductase [Flavobacteriaceae bacterium]